LASVPTVELAPLAGCMTLGVVVTRSRTIHLPDD
jgi:hypothetical protein